MTLPAKQFNAPGELHNDVYRRPKLDWTPLYYPNGSPTLQRLERGKLLWPGYEGTVQLDYKERIEATGGHYVFARGGDIPDHEAQPYGHVSVGDIEGPLGSPVPAGGGRGASAPLANRQVTLDVDGIPGIPDEMLYKPDISSAWGNYGDSGAKYGFPGRYSYMLWSSPRTEAPPGGLGATNPGGGIVRALMPNGGPLELCDVERLQCASVDAAGNRNGTVVLAYCERENLYGWVVIGHQYLDGPMVHHIA
ncbi:MAG: hypothetical protein ACJ76K_18550 [Solirubrobacteraceae bacterium]|jgi:hypothetical protein